MNALLTGVEGQASEPQARRSNAERRADMRALLIDAAIRCLKEKGFAGASTPAIAKLAGVSQGILHYHFPSKTDLIGAAIARNDRVLIKERFRAVMACIAAGGGMEAQLRVNWENDVTPVEYGINMAMHRDESLRQAYLEAWAEDASVENAAPTAWATIPGDPSPLDSRFIVGCVLRGFRLAGAMGEEDLVDQGLAKLAKLLEVGLPALAAEAAAGTRPRSFQPPRFDHRRAPRNPPIAPRKKSPSGTTARVSQEDRQTRSRTLLLDATMQSLIDKGFAAASTTEILTVAGAPRGVLYHYFSNKAELVAAAVRREELVTEAEQDAALARCVAAGGAVEEQLRTQLQSLGPEYRAVFEAGLAMHTDPELKAAYIDARVREPSPLGARVAAWVDDPGDPSPQLTRFLVDCFINGIWEAEGAVDTDVLDPIICKFAIVLELALPQLA